jgi:TetR/AcrR family transcriptional regulator of autoinduction and epiphytic fitness
MPPAAPAKTSFKEQMLQAREEAIVQTASRLLAEKGFESMTVDEVAASVGIAKASLYKHFPSKEDLAAAAMVRVMQRTLDFLASVPAEGQADRQAARRGALGHGGPAGRRDAFAAAPELHPARRADEQPRLPRPPGDDQRQARRLDPGRAGRRHAEPEAAGDCRALHAVRARLRSGARVPQGRRLQSDEQIVELVLATCFDGLASR